MCDQDRIANAMMGDLSRCADGPAPRGGRMAVVVGAVIAVVVVAALIVAWIVIDALWRKPHAPAGTEPLSADAYTRIVTDANLAIGLLENERELPRAADLFQRLVEQLPDEELPRRNLAITRLLLLQHEDPARRTPEMLQATQAAIEDLLARYSSAPANWLVAKFLEKLPGVDETERARKMVEYLDRASELDDREAAYPMAVYDIASISGDESLEKRGRLALQRAYGLAPSNLRVAGEWLTAQAREKDVAIRGTLANARQLLGPLALSIRAGDNLKRDDGASSLGLDVLALLDEAATAVDQGNWASVEPLVRRIGNGIGPMIVHRNDVGRISPHPLEFVMREFSDALRHEPLERRPAEIAWSWRDATSIGPSDLPPITDFALVDFDLDHQADWIVLLDAELRAYRGGAGGKIGDLMASVPVPAGSRGMVLGDLDNDHLPLVGPAGAPPKAQDGAGGAAPSEKAPGHLADLDIVVYGTAGLTVVENRRDAAGDRQLVPLAQPEVTDAATEVTAVTLVDFDHDADLDLVASAANGFQCWSGRGNATFEEIGRWSRLPADPLAASRLVAVDWERDVDLDILVAASNGTSASFLENGLHGHLAWTSLGDGFDCVAGASDLAVAELDGNPSWDLVVAKSDGLHLVLTDTAYRGRVTARKSWRVSDTPAERLVVADFDNNGHADILAWGAGAPELWLGFEGPLFVPGRDQWKSAPSAWRHARAVDVDRDGDLDLIVLSDGILSLHVNDGANRNAWLDVRLVGQCDNRGCAGHTGIGSLLEAMVDTHYQAQVVTGDVAHFGLGESRRADVLRIVWTNGVPQAIIQPDANQFLTELMTLKGSCPYIYTWTGDRFEFLTDCLWAAPLGMQVARGVGAPSRPWEYLKIPGERLVASSPTANGPTYDLQITEELWEAAYFDHMKLIAVDHPADVEIFSNEKVGPPDIANFQLHCVRERRLPRAARDSDGLDVAALLEREDDRCVSPGRRRIRQGLTDEHFLELDLGELASPRRITLFLTGWIYPTNTSLNVSFSQHPEIDGPRLPSVWTPDEEGAWREANAYIGFPGGKTKTIAIDLSKAFVEGDYRLRIVSSAEIYWDAAFFAVDEPAVDLRMHELNLVAADLHCRGYSERIPYEGERPERYDYARVTETPRWPAMRGYFTRYGDVRELLLEKDDQLAILGAGDEMTVRFAIPADAAPAGYRRDFILHSVGWDKDADLNTIHGQSVEPLPFNAMTEYPYADDAGPRGEAYANYLRRFQTRIQDPQLFWRQLSRDTSSIDRETLSIDGGRRSGH